MEFVSDPERKFSIAEARVAAKLDLWNAPQVRAALTSHETRAFSVFLFSTD